MFEKLKITFMVCILMVALVGVINLGCVDVGKETKAYSVEDTVFASGMDLYFENLVGSDDYLLDLSPYRNNGLVYNNPELTWGRYGKALEFDGADNQILVINGSISDGYLAYNDLIYNDTWDNPTGIINNSSGHADIGQSKIINYYISRTFLFFDTSSIPDGSNIESAILSLYCIDDKSETDFNITIQNGQPIYPHIPLESGDYEKDNYSGNGGIFDTLSIINASYNNITLNSDGRNWIITTGTTKFALRSNRDISGTAPLGISETEYIVISSSESSYSPRLIIEYKALDQYVEIQDSSSLDITNEITIQAWIYWLSGADSYILSKGDDIYTLYITSTGKAVFGYKAPVTGWGAIQSVSDVSSETWTHLAGVYNTTHMLIYVNGELDQSSARVAEIDTDANPLMIGRLWDSEYYFNGIIDEVRIYPFALEQAQIKYDMLTPMNKFEKYSFLELDGQNGSQPDYSGIVENDRTLVWAKSNPSYPNNYVSVVDVVAGFQNYRSYVTIYEEKSTTDPDDDFTGYDFIRWSWTFYKNGKRQTTYYVLIHPIRIDENGTKWSIEFKRFNPDLTLKEYIVNYTDYEEHYFPVIIDAWVGDDKEHFSIRVTAENVTLDSQYSFTRGFNLTDVDGNNRHLEWFDGWVKQRLYCQSQYDAYIGQNGYIGITSHRWVGLIILLVIIVVVGALAYQYGLRPLLQETLGLPLPGIPFLPDRPEDFLSGLADLAHQFLGGLISLGNGIIDALSPIVDAILKVVNPIIQGFINFMSDLVTALANVAFAIWTTILNAIDGFLYAIFPELGPHALTDLLSDLVNFIGWLATSTAQVISMFTTAFLFITNAFMIFTSYFVQWFNTLGDTYNNLVWIWNQVFPYWGWIPNILIQILPLLFVFWTIWIFIPLAEKMNERGMRGTVGRLELTVGSLYKIVMFLWRLADSIVNTVFKLVEAIPGIE